MARDCFNGSNSFLSSGWSATCLTHAAIYVDSSSVLARLGFLASNPAIIFIAFFGVKNECKLREIYWLFTVGRQLWALKYLFLLAAVRFSAWNFTELPTGNDWVAGKYTVSLHPPTLEPRVIRFPATRDTVAVYHCVARDIWTMMIKMYLIHSVTK